MDSKQQRTKKHVERKQAQLLHLPPAASKRRQEQTPDTVHRQLRDAESRILHLELRNRAILDALDDLQVTAAAEVDQLRHELEQTQQRCRTLADDAERSARERDEMNDVVLLLVKKVEATNNNYNEWRPARLQMSRSLSIVPQSQEASSSKRQEKEEECTCAHAYAPSVVAHLSELVARERAAHGQTLADGEHRIVHYEAAIARREAELACVVASCASCERCAHLASVLLQGDDEGDCPARGAADEVGRVTERVLEVEIRHIQNEVGLERHHQAKRHSESAKPPHPPEDPSPRTAEKGASLDHFNAQVDELRAEVRRLTKEKDALERFASAEFPGLQVTANQREAVLMQENERLRAALLANEQHTSDIPSRDPFLSPSPNSAEINSSFPPLLPDLSSSITATTFLTTYRTDDWASDSDQEGLNDRSLATDIPLPPSPPSPSPSRQSTPVAMSGPSTLHYLPHQSGSGPGSATSSSTAVANAATSSREMAARAEADIAAELTAARLDTERREREIDDLRHAIGALATD